MINKILKKLNKLNNERASLLLIAYLVIVVLLGLGSAFMVLLSNEAKTAERDRLKTIAFHIAEAGLERGLYNLRQDFVTDSTPHWNDGYIYKNASEDFAIGPQYGEYPSSPNFYAIPYADTSFNGGSYTVEMMNDASDKEHVWLRSTGTINDVSHTLLVYVRMVDVSPWGNAIFAGEGAPSESMINGNVNISGSVTILGDGLADGDLAINLGGTAELVRNNYKIMPNGGPKVYDDLRSLVPDLPTTVVGGETVETINANLRVKNGMVSLSGSSTVGEPNVTGDAYKESVDGVYVEDGWYDGSEASVYTDNDVYSGWDLGDSIAFPKLSDPSPHDPTKTVQQYFHDNALIITNEFDGVKSSDTVPLITDGTNSIELSGGVLTIHGKVYIDGNNDFDINSQGNNDTIIYQGSGALLVTGNVEIDANMITENLGTDASGDQMPSFPYKPVLDGTGKMVAYDPDDDTTHTENIIGIMSPNDMHLGMGAQRNLMGLFYSEGMITVDKGTNIIGTIVADQFDMVQVPDIFQVPETVNNFPDGMIGQKARWYMIVSWQKT